MVFALQPEIEARSEPVRRIDGQLVQRRIVEHANGVAPGQDARDPGERGLQRKLEAHSCGVACRPHGCHIQDQTGHEGHLRHLCERQGRGRLPEGKKHGGLCTSNLVDDARVISVTQGVSVNRHARTVLAQIALKALLCLSVGLGVTARQDDDGAVNLSAGHRRHQRRGQDHEHDTPGDQTPKPTQSTLLRVTPNGRSKLPKPEVVRQLHPEVPPVTEDDILQVLA